MSPAFFQWKHEPKVVLRCFAIGLVLSTAGVWLLWHYLNTYPGTSYLLGKILVGIFSMIAVLWTAVSSLELLRGAGSDVKPFLLVTVKALVRTDYTHGDYEAYRLADAREFRSFDVFDDQNHEFKGRQYVFRFLEGDVRFMLSASGEIAALDQVLEQARSAQGLPASPEERTATGLHLIPEQDGHVEASGARSFTKPTGETWMAIAAIFLLGFLLTVLLARVFSKLI